MRKCHSAVPPQSGGENREGGWRQHHRQDDEKEREREREKAGGKEGGRGPDGGCSVWPERKSLPGWEGEKERERERERERLRLREREEGCPGGTGNEIVGPAGGGVGREEDRDDGDV
jgi:hypothetical protein